LASNEVFNDGGTDLLPSGLSATIGPDEKIARFLTSSSSHFNASGIKPAAFLPAVSTIETSVFRHGAEPLNSLRALGAPLAQSHTLHGAAILDAASVTMAGLALVADEPPARHAAIRGWPVYPDDPAFEKAARKEKAMQLASCSQKIMF